MIGMQEDKRHAEEREKRRVERARQEAEAKEKRQKDLQARLGPRVLTKEEKRQVLEQPHCHSPSHLRKGCLPTCSLCTPTLTSLSRREASSTAAILLFPVRS